MKLSVVIVNYNVKYFLRQCLASVMGSERHLADGSQLDLEVWVVDNDSVDGSVEMVQTEFPSVHVIANHENTGFARANNQALRLAEGDLMLLLNPDTVVEHDTLALCAGFFASHADCGGLTVKMVDGHGRFLKESKRGFPTPEASFYKISGLVRIFPHHRRIAAYYAGHLDEDEVNEVDIMCGAFLMLRRKVYEQIGGLDESYFMYGEDIDYSWRIRLAGWKNYYFPSTRIIHYKGESTRKGSMNYVYTFYNAMAIFVRRYFSGGGARLFRWLLQMAIWGRAALAWVKRIAARLAVPAMDFLLAYGGWMLIKYLWEPTKGMGHHYYPPEYSLLVVPLYILILIVCSWLAGGYDRPVRLSRIARGIGIGTLMLLAFYSLLDESQRYSRMLLLLGSGWTLVSMLATRGVLGACHLKGYTQRARRRGNTLVVGSPEEAVRIGEMLSSLDSDRPAALTTSDATARHLQDLIRIEHAEEVVFCGRDIPLADIITLMAELRTTGVEYRIAPDGADYIIGSESILAADNLLLAELDTISTDTSQRTKRLFDMGTSTLLLILSPVLWWFQRDKGHYFKDCFKVLTGTLTWVGYTGHKGVFSPWQPYPTANQEQKDRLTLRYMRHYRTATDWQILLRCWREI